MKRLLLAALLLAALSPLPAVAHEITQGDLTVIHPTSRPSIPERPMVVYMVIANDGEADDRLVGVSAPDFDSVELHSSRMEGAVMSMTPVEAIDIPAGDAAVLEPGGLHMMLFGAKKLFRDGDRFPLHLVFEHGGEMVVDVMVGRKAQSEGEGHSHGTHN